MNTQCTRCVDDVNTLNSFGFLVSVYYLVMSDARPPAEALVNAADIARTVGVTRAAVSNWRRRYDDFPAPTGGTSSSPLFALSEVRSWLTRQRKGGEASGEVHLWQAIRAAYGEDVIRGLGAVADMVAGRTVQDVDAEVRQRTGDLLGEAAPGLIVEGLAARFVEATGRAGSEHTSTPHLVRAMKQFAGKPAGVVLDPACGIGSLLLALRGKSTTGLLGQDIDPVVASFAQTRGELAGAPEMTVRAGDSLRHDQWPDVKAQLVVCVPPAAAPDWGREDLLLDPRWELGVPSRAEGDLAWLQHCYAHAAPGGRVVIALPPSTAYRKAGRRIRAELVRRGLLVEVVALPPGVAVTHGLPLHLWVLRRPEGAGSGVASVRMTDLSANEPDGPFVPEPDQVADVPVIDLLDDQVDITPQRYVAASHADYPVDYAAARERIRELLDSLRILLPELGSGPGDRLLEGSSVTLADLARAGLVDADSVPPVSTSSQLDTDYVNGFLRSPANIRRGTSASGTFRVDMRGSRIPQMPIDGQRQYGAAFAALDRAEALAGELAQTVRDATAMARDGLTTGALGPQDDPPA